MDTRTLLAGGAASMIGIEAAAYTASLLKRRYQSKDTMSTHVSPSVPANDGDDPRYPYTVNDNNGSILCFLGNVFYVSNSILTVNVLQDTDNMVQGCFSLEAHYASMYNKAVHMKNRKSRFKNQCGIWMLHMLLSDLNTLLSLRPKGSLTSLKAKFIPVISNMTRNSTPKPPSIFNFWSRTTAYFLNTNKTAAIDDRLTANALFQMLQRDGAIMALAAEIKNSNNTPSRFFYIDHDMMDILETELSIAARYHMRYSECKIVTSKCSGDFARLRYVVYQ
jgi:hypothetical protein